MLICLFAILRTTLGGLKLTSHYFVQSIFLFLGPGNGNDKHSFDRVMIVSVKVQESYA